MWSIEQSTEPMLPPASLFPSHAAVTRPAVATRCRHEALPLRRGRRRSAVGRESMTTHRWRRSAGRESLELRRYWPRSVLVIAARAVLMVVLMRMRCDLGPHLFHVEGLGLRHELLERGGRKRASFA